MANTFNPSGPSPFRFGHSNDVMNRLFLSRNSNSGQTQANERDSLINSPFLSSVDMVHQNDVQPAIAQRGHTSVLALGGQLSLSQRLTELRRAYVTPQRMQIHSVIDYFPGQNQPNLPQREVTVTEVRTTKFIGPASTGERLFGSNDDAVYHRGLVLNNNHLIPGLHNLQNRNITMLNQVNHPITLASHIAYPQYNSSRNQSILNFLDLNRPYPEAKSDGEVLDPELNSVYAPGHGVQRFNDNHPFLGRNQNPNPNSQGINFHDLITSNKSNSIQVTVADDPIIGDDGKTHSLPHRKYGPYMCPRCNGVFSTSQVFAAHISSHYKDETFEERTRRLAAKNKNKDLYLVRTPGGVLRISPMSNKGLKTYARRKKANENRMWIDVQEGTGSASEEASNPIVGVTIEEEEGQGTSGAASNHVIDVKKVKEGNEDGIPGVVSNSAVDVKVKEEPIDVKIKEENMY